MRKSTVAILVLLVADVLAAVSGFVLVFCRPTWTYKDAFTLTVPDLVGVSEDDLADTWAVQSGTALDAVSVLTAEYRYDTAPRGTVISQSPAAGTERFLQKGATLALSVTVSLGEAPVREPQDADGTKSETPVHPARSARIPDLYGKTRDEAEIALLTAGFSVGTVTGDGVVTHQAYPAGIYLRTGTAVGFSLRPVSPFLSESVPVGDTNP